MVAGEGRLVVAPGSNPDWRPGEHGFRQCSQPLGDMAEGEFEQVASSRGFRGAAGRRIFREPAADGESGAEGRVVAVVAPGPIRPDAGRTSASGESDPLDG